MHRSFLVIALLMVPFSAFSDEGMWTIDNFPSDQVADKYNVDINDKWLRSAQLATTRLENGCTGSFSSPDGLVLTNNHCTWSCIRNLSSEERNLSDEGFMATSRDEDDTRAGEAITARPIRVCLRPDRARLVSKSGVVEIWPTGGLQPTSS